MSPIIYRGDKKIVENVEIVKIVQGKNVKWKRRGIEKKKIRKTEGEKNRDFKGKGESDMINSLTEDKDL